MEVGPKDIAKNEVRAVRRYDGNKQQIGLTGIVSTVQTMLHEIQNNLLSRARKVRDDHLKYVTEWSQFVPALDRKNLVLIPWCEAVKCEEEIKDRSGRR